ncbi:alpha/beta fold hydrolase [Streptomyces sp. NPDC058045]|uniref:alpha/beta fold hydrolase n=1 Tax=Streptomyces sp. NPDC058045 TaxID=3346311 RepID=UPI0036E4004A
MGGARLEWRDSGGAGRPVVLLHGLAGCGGEWEPVARELGRRGLRVVCLDLRGHGGSERWPAEVSPEAVAGDVAAVCGELGLRRPVLVGQSLGGVTALLAAVGARESVGGLVLVESAPGGPDPSRAGRVARWLEGWPVPFRDRAAAVEFFGGGPVGEVWAAGLAEGPDGLRPRFDPEVLVAMVRGYAERDWMPVWRRVECPVLVVFGQGGVVPGDVMDAMSRARPGSWAVSVPGAGHDLHLERPGALAELLTSFVSGSQGPNTR